MLGGLTRFVDEAARRVGVSQATVPHFDPGLIAAVTDVGFHPFILVRNVGQPGRPSGFVVCPTQNDVSQFVSDLAGTAHFADSKLLRGLALALQQDVYDAAESLFAWTQSPADNLIESIYIGKPETVSLPIFHGYPAYEMAEGKDKSRPADRVRTLEKAFHAYAETAGNDAMRFAIMEAMAFALCRALGMKGRYDEARAIVDTALANCASSLHLQVAQHALILKAERNPVPAGMRQYIGDQEAARQPDMSFDTDLLTALQRIGLHPFILVRRRPYNTPADKFLVCGTQNDAPQFVNDIAKLPSFANSRLLRGIERALQLEAYEAAELLFAWVKAQARNLNETIYLGKPADIGSPNFHGYPAYGISTGTAVDKPDDRLRALEMAFHTYAETPGNDALRFVLMEAFAFALSRALGLRGRYEQARDIVDIALANCPSSIHLKAAKYVLLLKIEGKAVPPRLEKYAGEDNGYLRQFVCTQPFERFDIGPDGKVLVCCGHWLPTTIGDFMTQPVDSVLNSARALKIRQSVTDGTYKYCNHLECGTMAQESLPRRDDIPHERTRNALARRNFRLDGIEQVMFAFDQTCNLSCPSCRTHVISEKFSQSQDKARVVEEKLLPLLPTLRVLHINPAGELFASKPSRKLLELINDGNCPDLKLDIISNGTLFSEEEWNKFPGIHNKVRSVRVSTDAASKETFEKLRRLGKYDVFCRNMRFLRDLRRAGVIPQLKFSFTYQLDNFREMRAFVDFCVEMAGDFVIFERLQNIAFAPDEYRHKAVHHPDHPLYAEFIETIKDPVFRTKRVWTDFDYDGVEKMSGEEARERLSEALVPAV